ncbi:tRNA pseudouridine(55) synthase TruB [Capnocytophaga sp. oral taxon 338]|uniref:tRNA pseudouridine(55) synthase TruB n=1 Tax=Capnocytophaga sp. oral taxon 338 TaxID=710239 RepID=UPI000202D6B2|nr:tRNA pseudouridine(55) synthase TruB [Capnocytophaga sp. oral taxon 338]EGD33842.1 tRNA pseudouridine synthase B [Capnocytophaga sp. oral taxon 338 str. F0234]
MESIIQGTTILIDKPLHWSSFQAVNKLKWAIMKRYHLKKFKIGHAGTLDPLATGLLILCTGKHTKQIPFIQDAPKTYTGTITLGATTPSYDLETKINATFPTTHITPELIEEIRLQFIGELTQAPPLFSAIKKDGKRLYELARKGEITEISPRNITIHSLNLVPYTEKELSFEVHCSKGTYIRSLAHDIGKALGSGAYLSSLRRTHIGVHSVENALSPDTFVQLFINTENEINTTI